VVVVMVDTYGIPRVVDARGTSFGRQQIQRRPQSFVKPLTCGGRTCSAAAVAVVGYLRLQTWVEPMFRLGPGAEHSAGCPFNVDHRIDDLVKAHRAVVEPKEGQYRLLLQIAEATTPSAPGVRLNTEETRGAGLAPNGARHPTRTLPPVIKAAAAVVQLLQDLDDDPVAKARFVAVNHTPTGRELLIWDEFCWPSTNSRELAADIRMNPGRPRAVWGRIAKAGPAKTGRTGFIQLETADGPSVRLRAKNEKYVAEKGSSEFVLGFNSHWELFPPDSPRSAPQMWITESWMLTTWNAST
jgi:hypothetical protein